MSNADREHTAENLIWRGRDYENITVSLYVHERDHIIGEHETDMMANNFTAIYDTVEEPDSVYESGSNDNRNVFFKKSALATYNPRFYTKVIVEYDVSHTSGFIVTAFPNRKEGGNVGRKIYPKGEI